MPGGRQISGRDVIATMQRFSPGRGDQAALRAVVRPRQRFSSYDELARAVPPERIGLTSGEHAALFGPLFGEFE